MNRLVIATLAALTLAGCASRADIAAYAEQECARMKPHGDREYDACVVQVTQRCEGTNDAGGSPFGCRPTTAK